ncbi:MAG: laccase domain-containing protein, partial [Halorhodospira halophila]
AAGILEAVVAALPVPAGELHAWLGPAIGPDAFEVGPEVAEALRARDPAAAEGLTPAAGDRWYADLYSLARSRLRQAGVTSVHGGGWCTHTDRARFFSHRRDGSTGRMASLIYREEP